MNYHHIKTGNTSLHIFFAGWGMDEHPFTHLANDKEDLLICYDYTDLSFDKSLLNGYRHIRLTAWSMGVWAAAKVLGNTDTNIEYALAVNGTHTPVNDTTGIPHSVFHATLDTLSEQSLAKFNRRMCGNKDTLDFYNRNASKRSIESLRNELKAIGEACSSETPVLKWNKVIAGERDLIFPYKNQIAAWGQSVDILSVNEAHFFDFKILNLA